MTLDELLHRYLEAHSLKGSLLWATCGGWKKFVAFGQSRELSHLQDVTAETVEDFYKGLLWQPNDQGQWFKPNSVDQYVRRVRQVLRWGAAQGLLASDPTVGLLLPRRLKAVSRDLSRDELQAVLNAPDRCTPMGLRDALLFQLLTETSLGLLRVVALSLEAAQQLPLESASEQLRDDYLNHGRPALARPGISGQSLFLTRDGGPLTAPTAAARLNDTARQLGLGPRLPSRLLHKSYLAELERFYDGRSAAGGLTIGGK